MALAIRDDVVIRLGRDLTDDEKEQADGLLDEASAIVEGYCGVDEFDIPVPDSVAIVVSRMVARVLSAVTVDGSSTVGLESVQRGEGPFQQSLKFSSDQSSGGPWLTKIDKLMLRRFRRAVVSVPLESERSDA